MEVGALSETALFPPVVLDAPARSEFFLQWMRGPRWPAAVHAPPPPPPRPASRAVPTPLSCPRERSGSPSCSRTSRATPRWPKRMDARASSVRMSYRCLAGLGSEVPAAFGGIVEQLHRRQRDGDSSARPVAHDDDADRARGPRPRLRMPAGDREDRPRPPACAVGQSTRATCLAGIVAEGGYTRDPADTVNVGRPACKSAAEIGSTHGRRAQRCSPPATRRYRRPRPAWWLKGKPKPVVRLRGRRPGNCDAAPAVGGNRLQAPLAGRTATS